VEAMKDIGSFDGQSFDGRSFDSQDGSVRLRRRVVERVLARCADGSIGDVEPLLTLLRRFAAEAAREEARAFCAELVADDGVIYDDMVDEGVIDADFEPSYDERAAA